MEIALGMKSSRESLESRDFNVRLLGEWGKKPGMNNQRAKA